MLKRFFANPAALPTMPELATRLLKSLERDDLSMLALANLIGRDPSLAAKLLRLANSAHYSRQRTISTLRDAVNLLGTRTVRDLALAACMAGLFVERGGFDRVRFWRHALASAGHSRVLAGLTGLDADEAYLAGLVARTGRILMLIAEPELVARTEALAQESDSLIGHERALLGCSHLQVSAELARRWNFPLAVCAAIDAAADPLAAQPFVPLGAVLRMASVLADAGERELPELETLLDKQPLLVQQFGLDAQRLERELLPFEALALAADQLMG